MTTTTSYKEITVPYAMRMCEGHGITDQILLIDEIANMPLPHEPRRMQCIFLALCHRGTARYFVDSTEYTVEAGDLLIINVGRVIHHCSMSHDCRGIGMVISYAFFKETIKSIHEVSSLFLFACDHPVFRLPPSKADFIRDTFMHMRHKIMEQTHHFRLNISQSLFLNMVYDISDEIYRVQSQHTRCSTRAEEIFARFLTLVERNFREERRVGWYSTQLGISPKYLSETVKGASKRTPNEWIDYYVTKELQLLLKNTQKSIKDITEEMHFSNQSFLGKYFKMHTGLSPSEYRKS